MPEMSELDRMVAEALEPNKPTIRRAVKAPRLSEGKMWVQEWDGIAQEWVWHPRLIATDRYAAIDALECWRKANPGRRCYRFVAGRDGECWVELWQENGIDKQVGYGKGNDFAAAAGAALDAWAKEVPK